MGECICFILGMEFDILYRMFMTFLKMDMDMYRYPPGISGPVTTKMTPLYVGMMQRRAQQTRRSKRVRIDDD